ncbi:MAG: hypothetical protein ACK5MD_06330 [Flavobacteriales bacterium]
MIYIQFLDSLEKLFDDSFLLSNEKVIVNIVAEKIQSFSLIEFARKYKIEEYKAIESDFVFQIINDLSKKYNEVIIGLAGMDKKNIYELIGLLKNKNIIPNKNIILVYNSINISKNGLIDIDGINSQKEFDNILIKHESNNDSFKFSF